MRNSRHSSFIVVLAAVGLLAVAASACGREVVKEIVKEVPVEKVVEKEVVREVVKEVPREVVKEVPKEVVKEVPKVVEVTKVIEKEKIVEKDPRGGGTLRVVAEASVASLDSIATTGGINQTVAGHIYDQLFNLGEGQVPRAQMVDNWSVSPDGLAYTFTLRGGLLFHDGTKVTSEDAVASIKRLIDRKLGPWAQMVERGITPQVVDEKTFTVKFKEPYGLLVETLATSNLYPPVQQARLASKTPANEPIKEHVGSGPFKLVKWNPGASIRMERFAEYVARAERADGHGGGKKVFVDVLEWLEVPDPGTRIVMLETGQVDFVQSAPQDDLNRLKKNRDLQVFPHPFGRWPVLIFNNINPPFDDVVARRAVVAAIDAEGIMAAYGPKDLWRTCGQLFGCGGIFDTEVGLENYNQRNIQKGKELLKQSKYDGRVIDVMVPTDQPLISPVTQIARPSLEAIGLKVNMVVTDWATVVQRRGKPDGYHIMSSYGTHGSPLAPSTAFATPHYCNCATDAQKKLSADFMKATNLQEKQRIATEKQRIYFEEVPWYQVGEFFSYHIGSRRLQGYATTAGKLGEPAFWNVWLEK